MNQKRVFTPLCTGRRNRRNAGIVLLSWFFSLPLLLGAGVPEGPPPSGQISGIVINVATGAMVSQASIVAVDSGVSSQADLDGVYSLSLPAGSYELRVVRDGFRDQLVKGIEVKAGATTFQDIALTPLTMDLGEVTVVAEAGKASLQALLAERKNALTLSDSIGAQEMSRLTGSDAADVMQRVTGVTVVDNKFVYVRGLGERYSNTMLNGAVLPSTQPDKKVVAMDLFPSAVLENVTTEKSYTPDQPGEFSGGLIKIRTRNFPTAGLLKASFSQGIGTTTTFRDFLSSPGRGRSWLGSAAGSQLLPSIIPSGKVFRATRFSTGGFTPEELQTFGRAFANNWTPAKGNTAPPNTSVSLVGGNTIGPLGFVFAFNYGNKFQNQKEEQNYYKVGWGGSIERFHDYQFDISTFSVQTGLTGNLAYELGKNHRLFFRNFLSRDSSDEARLFEGFNGDANNRVRNQRLRFVEESLYSSQFGGEHFFSGLSNSFLEWRLTYSRSKLNEPDIREVLYEDRGGTFYLADESQSGFRMFNRLNDRVWEGAVDWNLLFNLGPAVTNLKVGGAYRTRDRDFASRRFRFVPRNTRGIDLTAPPEAIYQSDHINSQQFELAETTRATDFYLAGQINRSGYFLLDAALPRWRFLGGLRLESDGQNIDTFDLFAPTSGSRVSSHLANADLLGSVGAVYKLQNNMNLRAAYSRTLNRPEFRELSPFEFTDVVGGRSVVGNPDLKRATIRNLDLRWEWFISEEELLSASFFVKRFAQPIERIIQPTSQLRTSFMNADKAHNSGLEVDVMKRLDSLLSVLRHFAIHANYTFVDSTVTIPDEALNVLTSLSRPLAGQSRHTFNSILEFEHPGSHMVARLLFNFQGQRITDVGALGLPDILERGYPRLDAIFIQPFASRWSFKASASNLLDRPHVFMQGDEIQRRFRVGREFSFGISYDFLVE